MASINAFFRMFKTQKQYSLDASDKKDSSNSVHGQKNTKDGRKCSQSHEAAVREVVCCTPNKTSRKTLFSRQVNVVIAKAEYKPVVEIMVKQYDELPSWDQRGGKARLFRMNQNEKTMRHLAMDLLPADDRKNKKKVQAVCDQLRRDVRAQTVERDSEQLAAQVDGNKIQDDSNKPQSILKPEGAPASKVKKTVRFANDSEPPK